jgi:hypothetical protein
MGVICLVRREHPGLLFMLTLMHITAIEVSLRQCYQGNQAQRYSCVCERERERERDRDKCYRKYESFAVFLYRLTLCGTPLQQRFSDFSFYDPMS